MTKTPKVRNDQKGTTLKGTKLQRYELTRKRTKHVGSNRIEISKKVKATLARLRFEVLYFTLKFEQKNTYCILYKSVNSCHGKLSMCAEGALFIHIYMYIYFAYPHSIMSRNNNAIIFFAFKTGTMMPIDLPVEKKVYYINYNFRFPTFLMSNCFNNSP